MNFQHKVRTNPYTGLSFARFRTFLFYTYFYYDGMPEDEANACMNLIVPMLHSIDNRLNPQIDEEGEVKPTDDTYIQYWIARDERLTQDFSDRGDGTGQNKTWVKLATVDIRFIGVQAEIWAKVFHHLSKRPDIATYMHEICNGRILEYAGPIIPVNVDYFGVGNSTIAFDLSIEIEYSESITLNWQPLGLIVIAPGEIKVQGEIDEEDA